MPGTTHFWHHFKPAHLLRRLAHSVLPSHCALCMTACAEQLCAACHRAYFSCHKARCQQCGLPSTTAHCAQCLQQLPAFDATIVATDYEPPADQLVLALKFGHRLALAPLFAHLLRDALLQQQAARPGDAPLPLPDLLLPVPLGPQRLRERGFNQALQIARPLARALGIALHSRWLLRARETGAQSLLHNAQRSRNVQLAFALAPQALAGIAGHHVGLVDDVMTTGATLNEVAALLKRHGATRVTNLVFARTPPS